MITTEEQESIRKEYEACVAERDKLIKQAENLGKLYLHAKQTEVAQKILTMSEEEKKYIIEHTEHSRSSCSDENPCNGLYSTDHNGQPGFRCPKCMLMEILRGDYGGKYDFKLSFDIFEVKV